MQFIIKGLNWFKQRVDATGAQYIAFGIFGVINYPGSYLIWHSIISQPFSSLALRLIAAVLCIPLIFHRYWPKKWQIALPLYWYITILYCLPFFGTYLLLMNNISHEWLMNMVLGLFLFVLLVDWLMFIILLVLGIGLAWVEYMAVGGTTIHILHTRSLSLAVYMYFFAILIGIVFSRSKEKLAEEKTQSMKLLAGSIAHELRTPLAAIKAGAYGIKSYLPDLLNTYERAKEQQMSDLPLIRASQFSSLKTALQHIETEAESSHLIINMLLMNLNPTDINKKDFVKCSITENIEELLQRYPFPSDVQEHVHWQNGGDFEYYGKAILTIHVLFNLMKNAIYYIKANKGEIVISLASDDNYNLLIFKDTGIGMDDNTIAHIFEQFYSNKHHGTGIGLAFCKAVMISYGGDIACDSIKEQSTTFTLKFPKLNKVP